jgi:hypothetical protein
MKIKLKFGALQIENLEAVITPQGDTLFTLAFVDTPGNPAKIQTPQGEPVLIRPSEYTVNLTARKLAEPNSFEAVDPAGSFSVVNGVDYRYPTQNPRLICQLLLAEKDGIKSNKVGMSIATNVSAYGNLILPDGSSLNVSSILTPSLVPTPEGILVQNLLFPSSQGINANPRGPESKTFLSFGRNSFSLSIRAEMGGTAPNVFAVSEVAGTDPKHTIKDLGLNRHTDGKPSELPIRKLVIDRQGIMAFFQSRAAFQNVTGKPIADHRHEPYALMSDPNVYLRPYQGRAFFAFERVTNPFGMERSLNVMELASGLLPDTIPAGDAWFLYEGEAYNKNLLDETNGPARIASKEIFLIHPPVGGSHSAPPKKKAYLFSATDVAYHYNQKAGADAKGMLSLGDVQLELAPLSSAEPGRGSIAFRSSTFTAPDGPGEWAFRFARGMKTPFRGDSPDEASPRQEIYALAAGKEVIVFQSNGVANVPNILEGLTIADPAKKVPCSQPQNVEVTFRQGTKLTRSSGRRSGRELMRAAKAGERVAEGEVRYSSIEAKLDLGKVPKKGGGYDTPTFTWKDTALAEPIANTNLARDWVLDPQKEEGAADFHNFVESFLEAGDDLAFGYGWGTAPEQQSANPQLIKIDLRKNLPPNVPLPPPALKVTRDDKGRAVKIQVQKIDGTVLPGEIDVSPWWSHIFDTELHPGVPGWSGLLVWNTKLIPDKDLPDTTRSLLKTVPVTVGWFDGLGSTAVCEYHAKVDPKEPGYDPERLIPAVDTALNQDPPKPKKDLKVKDFISKNAGDPHHYIALIDFDMLMHKGQVERLSFKQFWEMPFFDRDISGRRQFVQVRGQWAVPEGGGEKRLVLSATLPEKSIEVGWLGIERIDIRELTFTFVKESENKSRWKIDANGDIEFDAQTSLQWFDGKLTGLSFSRWQLDFENPFRKWDPPVFHLKNKVELSVKGFSFKLLSFKLPSLGLPLGGRELHLLGELKFGIPSFDFIKPDIGLALKFTLPDLNDLSRFKIGFEDLNLNGLEISLFNFISVKGTVQWKDTEQEKGFLGSAEVTWDWSDNNPGKKLNVFFRFASDAQNRTFWLAGLALAGPQGSETFDLGILKASGIHLIVGHKAGRERLRDAILKISVNEFKREFFGGGSGKDWLNSWFYEEAYDWLVGAHFQDLQIAGDAIKAKDTSLIFCDDGIFRLETDLEVFAVKLLKAMIAVDWKRRIIATSLGLPKFDYGAYAVDLGVIGLVIGGGMFQIDLGFPHSLDWSRSIKVRWTPPPWPVPINEVQGGFLFSISTSEGTVLKVAVAARAGYSFMLGADGGAFGAYISGSIFFGGVVTGIIGKGKLVHEGVMTFDASARGGLVVFGLRWDILSVELHAALIHRLEIARGSMTLSFGARMYAGFRICLTPCTCIGGSISFSYGCNTSSQTDFSPPDSSRQERVLSDRAPDSPEEVLAMLLTDNLISHQQYR